MIRARASAVAFVAVLVLVLPAAALARPLGVELWTDRGQDAVYEPGDGIQIKVRPSDDSYLLVYEIDSEGSIHLLFPRRGGSSFIEGRQTYRLPDGQARDQLVVDGPTGQGYIVAIAARDPFESLPWYLRPYDPRAAEVGYIGREDTDEGITSDGRIVGDPFVAMEHIRQAVLRDPEDRDEFATAYTGYYVHERVRYPRYVCYDCHRPGHWQWWDGFDPYSTSCSVFDFRVNWAWSWGPTYWFNCVPYYVYVVRPDCPPHYRPNVGFCFSSWDGWGRWNRLWSGRLTRYKSDAPAGYVPPAKYGWEKRVPGGVRPLTPRPAPPGFLAATELGGRRATPLPLRRDDTPAPIVPRTDWRPGGELRKPDPGRTPVRTPGGFDPQGGRLAPREPRVSDDLRPGWRRQDPQGGSPRIERREWSRPAPRGGENGNGTPTDRRLWGRPEARPRDPGAPRPPLERGGERSPIERSGPRFDRPSPRIERAPEAHPARPRNERAPEKPRFERPAPPPKEPAHDDRGNEGKGKGRG